MTTSQCLTVLPHIFRTGAIRPLRQVNLGYESPEEPCLDVSRRFPNLITRLPATKLFRAPPSIHRIFTASIAVVSSLNRYLVSWKTNPRNQLSKASAVQAVIFPRPFGPGPPFRPGVGRRLETGEHLEHDRSFLFLPHSIRSIRRCSSDGFLRVCPKRELGHAGDRLRGRPQHHHRSRLLCRDQRKRRRAWNPGAAISNGGPRAPGCEIGRASCRERV